MRVSKQLNTKNSEIEDRLRAVWEGRVKDVHGAALTRMDVDGLIVWDGEIGYRLTEEGRKVLGVAEFKGEPVVEKPALSEDGVKAAKAAAEVIEAVPNSNGKYAPKIEVYSPPCITIPMPSESERNLRRAAYASIRDGLSRALSAGQAMVPILDSLEETDPLLNGGAS